MMILLDHVAGSTCTSPDTKQHIPEGSKTLIILERDGSLRHYPPDRPEHGPRQAQINLHEDQAEPNVLDRILDFTFDVLGISNLELKVNEHAKR